MRRALWRRAHGHLHPPQAPSAALAYTGSELANRAGILRPNVYAQVRFAAVPHPDAVEVPGSAVLFDGARQYVYVEDGRGGFVKRDVTTGAGHEGRVVVLSGLAVGQRLVAEGAVLLDNQLDLSE